MKFRIILISVVLASVSLLQACGGGGGGGGTIADTPTAPAPVAPAVPVASVPTVADTVAEFNRLFTSSGANPMTANTQVMAAAQAHASYLTTITTTTSLHSEDPAKAGFTGVTPTDRVRAAGYDPRGTAGEVIAPDNLRLNTQADPLIPLRSLMNLPYHGLILLSGNHDVGIGLGKTSNGQTMYMVIDLASKYGEYLSVPAGEVRMWPCNGVDNILHKSIASESPNPISGRRLDTDPIGTPIYVLITEGQKLMLTTYELRNMATGEVATLAKVLGQNVADGVMQNQAALLPDKPLAVNTVYSAAVTGLANGKTFSKTCTFKTGNLSSTS